MTPYLHQTHNRIRIRSSWIQHNPQHVSRVIATLRSQAGITDIIHRVYAGSVAICFDPAKVQASELLAQCEQLGWMSSPKNKSYIETTLRLGAGSLFKRLAVTALKRTVGGPLVSVASVLMR